MQVVKGLGYPILLSSALVHWAPGLWWVLGMVCR